MSEIFVDQNCTVCSAYGKFINKKNKNVSVSNQLDLSNEDIARDEVVYVKNQEKFYASDAIIDEAIVAFDESMVDINAKNVDNKKVHFTALKKSIEAKGMALIEKINKL